MKILELHQRIIENKDWATILIVATLALIAITRSAFENRFNEFIKLIYNNKYLKIYKDTDGIMGWFNSLLFVIQILSFGFFIQILFSYFGFTTKANSTTFIQIITLLCFFILSKYLVEKIIATSFGIEEFNILFNLQKVSYRAYIGLLLFPITIFFFYNTNPPIIVIYILIAMILATSITTYIIYLKNYQKLIKGKLFYFILYLCTLEIAPYYFMYYWFTKILKY